ncbi:hypothetical protein A4A49_33589 [Nicotiana attenuata]|uniref:Uncharacterized protein n=1 Tax=Nicotiana attenuata TaxID=49451 RepID=A0A1J6I621_NICAT|nr:hypothetical protein A4A49_33589 [Nicotiana attenuata]
MPKSLAKIGTKATGLLGRNQASSCCRFAVKLQFKQSRNTIGKCSSNADRFSCNCLQQLSVKRPYQTNTTNWYQLLQCCPNSEQHLQSTVISS